MISYIYDLFICSLKELLSNKLRTTLTVFSIIISTIFIISFIGTSHGIKSFLFKAIDEKATYKQIIIYDDTGSGISFNDLQFFLSTANTESNRVIRECDGLTAIDKEGLFAFENVKTIRIIDDSYDFLTSSEITSAETKTSHRINVPGKLAQGIYVSEKFITDNRINDVTSVVKKHMTLSISNEKTSVRLNTPIVGVVDTSIGTVMDESQYADIYITYGFFKEKNIECRIKSIVLDVGSYDDVKSVIRKLSGSRYPLIAKEKEIKNLEDEIFVYNTVLSIGGILIIAATVLSIINTLNVSLKERIKFFGILKSVGFSFKSVFAICILQSINICVMGSIIGAFLSVFISKFIGYYLAKSLIFQQQDAMVDHVFAIDIKLALYGILILFCTSLFSGTIPAVRSVFLSPIQALSSEK